MSRALLPRSLRCLRTPLPRTSSSPLATLHSPRIQPLTTTTTSTTSTAPPPSSPPPAPTATAAAAATATVASNWHSIPANPITKTITTPPPPPPSPPKPTTPPSPYPKQPQPTPPLSPTSAHQIRTFLPLLRAQPAHYITAHIHGRPYLVTRGDSIRLPYQIPHLQAGDVLGLDRASVLGSRDFTLKAERPARYQDFTVGRHGDGNGNGVGGRGKAEGKGEVEGQGMTVIVGGGAGGGRSGERHGYLDERLFTCRAVVMGVETEPLRRKEKTKRRCRKVKTVKSKQRFTVLRIAKLSVHGPEAVGL